MFYYSFSLIWVLASDFGSTVGPKLPIHFNIRMQPIGDGSTKFSSFVGKTARIHCSPIYSDWQSVPDQMKKHVWKTVSVSSIYSSRIGFWLSCLTSFRVFFTV